MAIVRNTHSCSVFIYTVGNGTRNALLSLDRHAILGEFNYSIAACRQFSKLKCHNRLVISLSIYSLLHCVCVLEWDGGLVMLIE